MKITFKDFRPDQFAMLQDFVSGKRAYDAFDHVETLIVSGHPRAFRVWYWENV